jgi:hypothetical protein
MSGTHRRARRQGNLYAGRSGAQNVEMPPARPLPATGSVFVDARGGGRALRVSWHAEVGMVVLSLWRENVCAGSFRVPADEVPALIAALASGLAGTGTAAKAG